MSRQRVPGSTAPQAVVGFGSVVGVIADLPGSCFGGTYTHDLDVAPCGAGTTLTRTTTEKDVIVMAATPGSFDIEGPEGPELPEGPEAPEAAEKPEVPGAPDLD